LLLFLKSKNKLSRRYIDKKMSYISFAVFPNDAEMFIQSAMDFMMITFICLGICTLCTLLTFFDIPTHLYSLWQFVWNSLTPGQQWLEIMFILSSALVAFTLKYVLDDFSDRLDKKMLQMKAEIAAKDEEILILKKKLNKLTDFE